MTKGSMYTFQKWLMIGIVVLVTVSYTHLTLPTK